MAEEIVNRIAESKLVTFNLEDFYPKGERVVFDISDWLLEGFVLREKDFREQHTIVLGTASVDIFTEVRNFYKSVLNESGTKYFHLSYEEAEMVKSSQNTILASRVALANVIFDACRELDIDYNKIRKIAFDRFEIIGPHMVEVPGPDGKRGFGGKCLPKDLKGFNSVFDSTVLKEIIDYNESIR